MNIKETKFYQFAKQADIDANEAIGGNKGETISAQTARGLRERRPGTNDKLSMDMAHGNMLLGGAGIVAGAALMKKKPGLGLATMLAGALITGVTVNDWKKGKY